MHSRSMHISKSAFDEKYALYSSVLYRLGFLYLAQEEYILEAIQEAFSWLFSRKKRFKTPEMEKRRLLRHMILICDKKSKVLLKSKHGTYDENSCTSELTELLEIIEGLPPKYQNVIRLYFCEGLSLSEISKLLYQIKPVVKQRLKKGVELMEMVMEKNMDSTYCRNNFSVAEPDAAIKEQVYMYLTSHHRIRRYFSSLQKTAACIIIASIAAASTAFVHFYPQIRSSAITKYAFMNGTICSFTLDSDMIDCYSGLLFTYEYGGTQCYRVYNKSLIGIVPEHVFRSFDYLGQSIPIDLHCYENDDSLVAISRSNAYDYGFLTFSSIKGSTENLLVTMYRDNEQTSPDYSDYPLILNINTMQATDFISACNISDLGKIRSATVNDDATAAVITDENGDLFYCDIKASSLSKIASYKDCRLNSLVFCNDGTILYEIYSPNSSGDDYLVSYYEYSVGLGTIKLCYQYSTNGYNPYYKYIGATVVISMEADSIYKITDIRSQASSFMSIPCPQGGLSSINLFGSPDERHIMFECSFMEGNTINLSSIYIYDMDTKKITKLNLSDLQGASFLYTVWYDNDHILLMNYPSIVRSSYYRNPGNDKSTLWLVDINRLH